MLLIFALYNHNKTEGLRVLKAFDNQSFWLVLDSENGD